MWLLSPCDSNGTDLATSVEDEMDRIHETYNGTVDCRASCAGCVVFALFFFGRCTGIAPNDALVVIGTARRCAQSVVPKGAANRKNQFLLRLRF